MSYNLLSTVALAKDIPEHHLRAGDLGAIVQIYGDNAIEVEFVAASGRTVAVLTLNNDAVRSIDDHDMLAVRHAV